MNQSDEKKSGLTGCCGWDFRGPMAGGKEMPEMMEKLCGEGGSFDCSKMLEMFRDEDGSFDVSGMMEMWKTMTGEK